MKFFFFCCLVLSFGIAQATNYYVDPSSKVAGANGAYQSPWTTLLQVNEYMPKLKAGDSVLFKRGELFLGNLQINQFGNANMPIVFAPYGDASAAPFFQYETTEIKKSADRNIITIYKSRFIKVIGLELSDPTMDDTDHSILANVAIAVYIDKSENIQLLHLKISLVGTGILISGNNNVVDKCVIKNLRMIKSDNEKEDDDYGASAIVIDGNANMIKNNVLKDCWGKSVDYSIDGGGIEIYGTEVSNNTIENNVVMNCNGFMELGSRTHGTANNNVISNNLLLNNGIVFYIQKGGNYFDINVTGMQFTSNKIFETNKNFNELKSLIGIGPKRSEAKNIVYMSDNIFIVENGTNINNDLHAVFADDQLIHDKNVFILKGAKLNFNASSSDKVFQLGEQESLTNSSTPQISNLIKFFYNWLLRYITYLN